MTSPAPSSSASAARQAAWRRLSHLRLATGPAGETPEGWEIQDRRDRAQANRMVRGVLQNLTLLDAYLERGKLFDPRRTPTDILWILRLAAYEKIFQASVPDYAIGNQAVELARKAGGERAGRFVNAIMRRLLPAIPDSPEAMREDPFWVALPPIVRWSTPEPILKALAEGYGAERVGPVLQALTEQESPIWLRVNTLKTTRERLIENLEAESVKVLAMAGAPAETLLWVHGSRLPWETEPWRRGELTVQDLGAMLAARLLAPEPGERVLDSCAAPGGKTGHLWELMQGKGRLVAFEVSPERRAELCQTLARLYPPSPGLEAPEWDAAAESAQAETFDRVLIDAPCQALGLIRRHPEIRWDGRLRFQEQMQATQRQILDRGARCLRPGGRLLWVTCSPTVAENEGVVLPWLKEHPGWRLVDPAPLLRAEWRAMLQIEQGVVRTRPDLIACDGFALILLERLQAS